MAPFLQQRAPDPLHIDLIAMLTFFVRRPLWLLQNDSGVLLVALVLNIFNYFLKECKFRGRFYGFFHMLFRKLIV